MKSLGRLDRSGERKGELGHSDRGVFQRVGSRHLHIAIDLASTSGLALGSP